MGVIRLAQGCAKREPTQDVEPMDMMKLPHQVKMGDKAEPPALYADISDAEFYAIGKMTTSWAILEHLMMATATQLAKEAKPPASNGVATLPIIGTVVRLIAQAKPALPKNFSTLPFETRFRVFQNLIKAMPAGPAKARLDKIASRIANVQAERHDFTHGLWDWSAGTPAKITVDHVRKKGRRRHKKYDSASILQLAERIAQLNFDLCYPEGTEQFFAAKAQIGCYMSRRFLMHISGEEIHDPTLRLPNTPLPPEIREALDRLVAEQGSPKDAATPQTVIHGISAS
jgi:hypothetical protein